MKAIRRTVVAGLLVCGIGGLAFAQTAMAKTFISIASNPVGNTAYQWAAGIADVINRNVSGVEATAEATKGYVVNVRLILDHKVEAGFSNSKTAFEAYNAQGLYAKEKPGQVMSWMSIAPIIQHVIVLKGSSIHSLADLKGKRVGIGQPGGTSMLDAEILMNAIGLTPGKDFEAFRVRLPQMVDMLGDGQLDALVWNGSIPLPPVMKLLAQHNIRFISIPKAVSAKIHAKYPPYYDIAIPAHTYDGQNEAVESYGLSNVLVIRADVPSDLVYKMTKAVMENQPHLATVHPAFKRLSKQTVLQGFKAPLHPGALRYFREIGAAGVKRFEKESAK